MSLVVKKYWGLRHQVLNAKESNICKHLPIPGRAGRTWARSLQTRSRFEILCPPIGPFIVRLQIMGLSEEDARDFSHTSTNQKNRDFSC